MDRIGERIDGGDRLHPPGESLLRIYGAARKIQQRVQDAEHRAGHQGIGDAHHQQEHQADERERGRDNDDEEPHEPERIERTGDAGDERSDRHQHEAGEHRFDRAREIEAGDQLELANRRDEIAFVQAARLVVDEDDAAADHHHHEDGHHHRSGQEVLHVGNVWIHLDHVESGLAAHALPARRLVVRRHQVAQRCRQRHRHEVVGVVLDEGDAGLVSFEHTPRKLRRNRQHAVDAAVSKIGERLSGIGVLDGVDRSRPGRGCRGQLPHLDGRHTMVLIDHADFQMLDVAPEGVAQHDELYDRKDHRHDDEHRAAPEPPQLALDDGPCAVHLSGSS